MSHRPQRRYRLDFRQLVLAERPRSVLDLGCGSGSLLRWLDKGGITAQGVDADESLVGELREAGYGAQCARAEELPFADGEFDVVASEFCAHHFEDLQLALAEAMRVARRAVWLLDPWYDVSLDSQRRALRWDSWFKRIDRRRGTVHNEVLSVADFLSALPGIALEQLEFRHWLRLVPIGQELFDAESDAQLPLATAEERDELAEIRRNFVEHGMTDDGAIVVRIAVTRGQPAV